MTPFLRGYLTCALWSTTYSDETGTVGGNLDDEHDVDDFTPEALASATEDCEAFQRDNADDLAATEASDERNGHDFWLTRNRHGAGFWDRGYGAVGERLSKAARVYGSVDLMPQGDGTVG